MERHITLPLTEELAKTLKAGDSVYVTGTIYTSRDAGHKRMCEALARGEELPFDPADATIYYVGPTPAKPGQVIGSAGPTTSGRMDAYAPTMMSVGARGMIGKGARLPEVVDAMKKYSGVYFGAIGGAGALLLGEDHGQVVLGGVAVGLDTAMDAGRFKALGGTDAAGNFFQHIIHS